MATDRPLRNWMKIQTRAIPIEAERPCRQVAALDAEILGALMDRSYRGTIDHEGETLEQCIEEMKGTLAGKYGSFLNDASFLIEERGQAISASLITLWQEKPLVTFSMTDPAFQGKGCAGFLIERSIHALADMGYPELHLVVTAGNASAEHLYRRLGFILSGRSAP